jgi:hypothetical protein
VTVGRHEAKSTEDMETSAINTAKQSEQNRNFLPAPPMKKWQQIGNGSGFSRNEAEI